MKFNKICNLPCTATGLSTWTKVDVQAKKSENKVEISKQFGIKMNRLWQETKRNPPGTGRSTYSLTG